MIRVFMIGFSHEKGGVETYISNLINQLDCTKYEVVLCMPEMTINGKKWIQPINRHNYIWYYLFWKSFFIHNQFDVLYLNECDIISIDFLRFAKSAKIPIRIIHSHSAGSQLFLNKPMSLVHRIMEKQNRRTLDKYATHLFACSKDAGDWMFDGRPYEIIKNGIQLSKFRYNEKSRKELRIKYGFDHSRIVGIIGRLSVPKNPVFSVRVIEELRKLDSGIQAVFIGDGELKSEVEAEVINRDLRKDIKFVGAVDNVNEWLSAIDVLLMPSLFEALPFVLIEAQAAGLPCVVSSEISSDANIIGSLNYVSLNEPPVKWAYEVRSVINQERIENKQALINAGYSIEDTADKVSSIIMGAIENNASN